MIPRAEALAALERDEFDVVVIGGGITGAGVALDAASRGYSVALVEKADYASGTSSRSSKLVHGGLRYLQNFDLGLVREALLERQLMVNLAPHLVKPLALLIPAFDGKRPDRLAGVGLNAYDVMARERLRGRGDDEWSPERHRTIDAEETVALLPALASREPTSAYLFYDCQTDDARLVLTVLGEAERFGAVCCNGVEVSGLVERDGRATGVLCRDAVDGAEFELIGANVVNATGVWADRIRPDELHDEAEVPTIRPSRGTHVTVSQDDLPVVAGAIVPAGSGRSIFVLPWLGRTLIGTTDNDYEGSIDHVPPGEEDVEYLLHATNEFFGSSLTQDDLTGAYAGVRPLISTGDPKKSVDISRKAELYETSSGHGHDHRRQAHHLAADGEDGRGPDRGARGPRRALPDARDPARHVRRAGRAGAVRAGGGGLARPPRGPIRPRRRRGAGDRAVRRPSWRGGRAPTFPTSWRRQRSPRAASRRARWRT